MTDVTDHTTSITHAETVERAVLYIQPRNGSDYSEEGYRIIREMIAVNVHNGLDPLEGVRG